MGELLNYCHTQVRLMVNADKNAYFKRQLKKKSKQTEERTVFFQ